MSVIWHDLECGPYVEDLRVWRALAAEHGDPVLDVGAGTGRVALDLARRGHRVTALDADPVLTAELTRRAGELPVQTVLADARRFELGHRFALCVVPMQTVQLLGGPDGRHAFLECARRHLSPGGVLAIAIAEDLELYDVPEGAAQPVPDICERDGVVYSSQPTAVRAEEEGFVLERRRETVGPDGARSVEHDRISLDYLSAGELEDEAAAAGFTPAGRRSVPATSDYVGSEVVIVRA